MGQSLSALTARCLQRTAMPLVQSTREIQRKTVPKSKEIEDSLFTGTDSNCVDVVCCLLENTTALVDQVAILKREAKEEDIETTSLKTALKSFPINQ